jgi:hypothetical protein
MVIKKPSMVLQRKSTPRAVICLGISDWFHLCLLYAATDMFVISFIQINFPNISVETHACATSVLYRVALERHRQL